MKVNWKKAYMKHMKWLNVHKTKAGESFDVDNILTSPDLLLAVGLPAGR